jgi:hypothetical protein
VGAVDFSDDCRGGEERAGGVAEDVEALLLGLLLVAVVVSFDSTIADGGGSSVGECVLLVDEVGG